MTINSRQIAEVLLAAGHETVVPESVVDEATYLSNVRWVVSVIDDTAVTETKQTPPLSWADVVAEVSVREAEKIATQYQRDRAAAYPPIGDQLDALYHAGVFPDDMAALIAAVKSAHPKPE